MRTGLNVRILIPVLVLGAGNVVFHIESHLSGIAEYGLRIGIAAIIVLIMLIGGRVIPSFTRNWLLGEGAGRLPPPFASFDAVALVLSAVSLALWIVSPIGTVTGVALLASCLLQTIRLLRWAGDRTLANRLVLVLHVAYAFVPLGFGLTALAAFGYILPSVHRSHEPSRGCVAARLERHVDPHRCIFMDRRVRRLLPSVRPDAARGSVVAIQ